MSECAFTRWFCRQVEACGSITLTFVGGNVRQQRNLPDRYVCHWQFRGWVEFKKGDGKLRDGQRILVERLVERGDTVRIVRWQPKNDYVHVENVDGTPVSWVDLAPLRVLSDKDCGLQLLLKLNSE